MWAIRLLAAILHPTHAVHVKVVKGRKVAGVSTFRHRKMRFPIDVIDADFVFLDPWPYGVPSNHRLIRSISLADPQMIHKLRITIDELDGIRSDIGNRTWCRLCNMA
jgi:hypothetical protein